jgi:hypothetical protein
MTYGEALSRWGAAAVIFGVFMATASAQGRPPDLVPRGWHAQKVEGRDDVIRYVSPDGQAILTLRDISRNEESVRREFALFADRAPGPITYKRIADSWFVLSGDHGGQTYYTRVDLACGGRRWHIAELTYPLAQNAMRDFSGAIGTFCTPNQQLSGSGMQ